MDRKAVAYNRTWKNIACRFFAVFCIQKCQLQPQTSIKFRWGGGAFRNRDLHS